MRKFLVLVPLLGILFFCSKSIAQCTVPGWASLNGGVTGGGSATPKIVTNYNELKAAITSSTEKVVHISGTIVIPSGGRILFQDQSNKTIYGLPGSKLVSNDLTKDASGILYIKKCSNILFQNVTLEGPGAYDTDGWDNMTIDNSTNVWVDHCEFQDGMDGNLDIKNAADYISVTWCKFIYNKAPVPGGPGGANDHRFSDLFGSGDGATGDRGKLRVTMQNCWWAQGCKARMPRVRFGKVHIVNNLFNSTVAAQCVMAGFESDLLVERNVFENVKSPIDKLDNTFTAITVRGNIFNNIIGDTTGSGTAFTPPYALLAAPVTNVKSRVMAGAGATLTSPSCNATTSYILNTTVTPTAGGTVTGGGTYNAGTSATITATPATGYTFTGWSGAATGTSSSVTVAMDANKSVTANFQAQVSAYILSTTASPTAGGTVTGAGSYSSGATATLTANPATGYTFTGWSGDVSDASASVYVTMNANKSVTANFQAENSSGTSTIRIEDSALTSQGLCSYEGAISSNTGASNGKVINLSNSAGKGINWKVYIPSEGSYTFTWHYVNGGSSNAYTMALLVNGTTVNNALPFARTSGSTIFSTVAQTVTLKAGVNAIRLQSLSSAATADIDWIEITGNTPATADCTAAMSASARSVGTETESIAYSENAVRISPNPAKDNATITISLNKGEHAAIMVYDDQGNLVDTLSSDKAVVTGTQQVVYAVGNKRPGIYTIVVVNNKGAKTTYKLLVE